MNPWGSQKAEFLHKPTEYQLLKDDFLRKNVYTEGSFGKFWVMKMCKIAAPRET
jgi:hypothetical protein